ncbi:phage tail tube protein [Pseudomonas sp. 21LCFQ010]|uniref:phage tail tube protein n=1 Tax=Pseudomonas sp. 21LCFQ010 TaxID=2957506 RepID=UPI0020975BAA|nr:phage tail tube protein [Pseudomonas sp. 21LCFQ010]MCO8160716.1 phage tail tube protein [Pseudomonas sp. 21LCFQ010]
MSKMANGSAVETYYIEEVSGAIAANPAWKPIRFVSSGLTPNINQIDTAEMNQSRQRPPSRGGTYSVAGDIAVELSFASFDDLIQAAMQGTWTANVLKIGKAERSFAILERHTDIGVDYIYRGCRVGSMAISSPLNAPVGVTFSMLGTKAEKFSLPAGSTFVPATASDIMITTNLALKEGGVDVAYATEWSVTLDNGMEALFALGSREAFDISNGVATVTGSLSAYLVDEVLWDKVLNETSTSHSIEFAEGNDRYTLTLPKVRYTQGQKQTSGPGAIIPQYTVSAGYDETAGTTMSITRSA